MFTHTHREREITLPRFSDQLELSGIKQIIENEFQTSVSHEKADGFPITRTQCSRVETQVQFEITSFPVSIPSALNKTVMNQEAALWKYSTPKLCNKIQHAI